MEVSVKVYKRSLRREALALRRSMSRYEREKESIAVFDQLKEMDFYKSAKCVFCYVSVEDEVHTGKILRRILADGKKLCVPYILDPDEGLMSAAWLKSIADLVPGAFGINTVRERDYQEVSHDEIDLVIVPGIAFDRKGHRVGMGRGFYDRFLKKAQNADKVAIAFDCQIFNDFEVESYDVAVDYLLTMNGAIKCSV